MSKAEVTFMTEELVKELALRLMDERGMTMKQALDTIYNSETYTKLLDESLGLFSQSTVYAKTSSLPSTETIGTFLSMSSTLLILESASACTS